MAGLARNVSTEYPSDWKQRRKQVYKRDDYECQNCGAKGGPRGNTELHAHHIVPKASGGTHQLGNLKTICEDCHSAIHNDVQAPTANIQEQTDDASDSNLADTLLFDWSVRFNGIRILLGENPEDDTIDATHRQFGLLFYARTIFIDSQTDIIEFASRGETIPRKLHRRYTTAISVMEYILGEREDIEESAIEELIDVASPSIRPHQKIQELKSELDLNELDTIDELIEDLTTSHDKSTSQEFDGFLTLTEKLIETIERDFQNRRQVVSIGSDGTVTLSASKATAWEQEEINEEIQQIMPKWLGSFKNLSEKGIERANKGKSHENWEDWVDEVEEMETPERAKIVCTSGIIGAAFGLIIAPGHFVPWTLLYGMIGFGLSSERIVKLLKP